MNKLKVSLVFSSDISALSTLDNAIKDIQKTVQDKQKSFKISIDSMKENELFLNIESEGFTHTFVPRIKNLLMPIMKKSKIGIRTYRIIDYVIEVELEKKPKHEFTIPMVTKFELKGKKAILTFDESFDTTQIDTGVIERIVTLVKDKVTAQFYEGKAEYNKIIWTSKEIKHPYKDDPTDEMVKKQWIVQGPGQGQWFHTPSSTALFKAMEKIAVEKILKPLGFREVIAPKVVPFEVWEKTGHLSGSEPEMYFVSMPKSRDIKDWEEVIDHYKITKKAPVDKIKKMLKDPVGGLCYAQCPTIYNAFQGKTIAKESLPLLIFDRSGVSNRNEAGGRHGIERVNEFHRIEPVFIGTIEQVEEIKKKLMDTYKDIFEKILKLEWRYSDVVPFYMQQSGGFGADKQDETNWKGTIDFEAYLPYRGTRTDSEWLEFQNLSVVGDKYTKAFNIKGQGVSLWSGCTGIGLERWVATFLAQHGLDKKNWPKEFLEFFEETEEIKFL